LNAHILQRVVPPLAMGIFYHWNIQTPLECKTELTTCYGAHAFCRFVAAQHSTCKREAHAKRGKKISNL
jgi:hypothetical protein